MEAILEQAILKELSRLIVAPERVIKLRIHLYHHELNRDYLWGDTHYAVENLRDEGSIKPIKPNKRWFYSKEIEDKYGMDWIKELYHKKHDINERWNTEARKGGYLLENMVRGYLNSKGIIAKKKIVKWKGKEIRIDAYNPKFAIEVKNVFSDAFYNPESILAPNKPHQQIERLFKYCKSKKITPILIAPLIDNSFYKFAKEHNGLFCRTFIQVIPPTEKALAREIDKEFRINNVKATNRLPKTIARWIDQNLINHI